MTNDFSKTIKMAMEPRKQETHFRDYSANFL